MDPDFVYESDYNLIQAQSSLVYKIIKNKMAKIIDSKK